MEPRELETLLTKVGGKFKLVTLFQKRMRELQRGLPKLIETDATNPWEVVALEVSTSKVDLIMGEEAEQMRKETAMREAEELPVPEKGKAAAKPAEAAKAE
ncbi:MAG TPA: DNA-directed RNA polymerase subunit omega [Planctomycetota bacterium]|jgi:DNA-directed RNA polymerase subunit K/omega